jgi:hypothetical protein
MNLQVRLFYMDSISPIISSDMWYVTWFLKVREIWPCEVGEPS